jgi:hypothetical protein
MRRHDYSAHDGFQLGGAIDCQRFMAERALPILLYPFIANTETAAQCYIRLNPEKVSRRASSAMRPVRKIPTNPGGRADDDWFKAPQHEPFRKTPVARLRQDTVRRCPARPAFAAVFFSADR